MTLNNPFFLNEFSAARAFCDREKEQQELIRFAGVKSNTVVYAPWRCGKTSLVKRVQQLLGAGGTLTAYCDLSGVCSVDEIAGKIAQAVFSATHINEKAFNRAIGLLTSFRPVFFPGEDGGAYLSVQPAFRAGGIEVLNQTLEGLGKFVQSVDCPVHIVLDEFQEICGVENCAEVEATLGLHIKGMSCAFVFIGSRRRLLLGMFNDQKRPLFQSALAYELKALPPKDLIRFMVEGFKGAGKHLEPNFAAEISDRFGQHPYYSLKLCFFLLALAGKKVAKADVMQAARLLLGNEQALFESMLQRLTPVQLSVLAAIAKEPSRGLYAAGYIKRHNLRSIGGIQLSVGVLSRQDMIEADDSTGEWRVVDPLFREWLVRRSF